MANTAGSYRIQVLERAFQILDVLAEDGSGATLLEIAAAVDLHKSTAHRLLMVPESARFIERNATGKYRIGSRVMELGLSAAARLDVYEVAPPYLRALGESTCETAHLAGLVSGPVLLPKYHGRNKTFWLFGFQRHQELGATANSQTTVPTAAMVNGDFSFGGQTTPKVLPIYNPFSTTLNGTTYTREPFPGNIIPKSLFDPVAMAFLARQPFAAPNLPGVPSSTGPTLNENVNPQKWVRRTRWDVKLDHQFTPNHSMFARYSQARHRTLGQGVQFSWVNDPTQTFSELIDPAAAPMPIDEINLVLSDMMILSPTMNNEFRFGYNRRQLFQSAPTANQDWAKQLGIPNVSGATFPNFNIGYGLAGLTSYQNIGDDITLQDNFTKIHGPHTIKFGYEMIRTRYNATVPSLPGGTYTFGGTEAPFTPNTGMTFASFLLGTGTSATFTQAQASWLPRWFSHQAYLQDDWKPLHNLTLNLGVRYDYETPFATKYGQNSEFSPTVTDTVTGRTGGLVNQKGPLANPDRNNFEPRVGLAWNFAPKMVFRSSFGVIHADIFAPTQNIMFHNYVATATVQAAPGDPNYVFRLSQGPPSFTYKVQPDGSVPFVGTNFSTRTASLWDRNMRMPYVMNWSGGVQWEFANNWVLETLYQGQAGIGLVNAWNTNVIPLNVSTDPAVLATIYKATQNYLPYPQFGAINYYSNFGHNTHHSGTLRVEKRFAKGLMLNAFYTFQKSLANTDGEGVATGITYYNQSLEKARTSFDTTHRFVRVITYQLPFGKGRHWMNHGGIFNPVLGAWELTETQTFQSGTPFTVTFSGSPYQYLPGASRPDILTTISQATVQNWDIGPNRFPTSAQNPYLNFSSFGYPAPFTAGTLGRNTIEGPGLNWMQISLVKWWTVKEHYRFEARLDGYNWPLEQPNYANPSSVYNSGSPGTFCPHDQRAGLVLRRRGRPPEHLDHRPLRVLVRQAGSLRRTENPPNFKFGDTIHVQQIPNHPPLDHPHPRRRRSGRTGRSPLERDNHHRHHGGRARRDRRRIAQLGCLPHRFSGHPRRRREAAHRLHRRRKTDHL
jgi:hypothetical protein